MGWSVGYDDNWNRDIGYVVPAICDHPDCAVEIDRGLAYVCKDQEPYGGDGCGLYFCDAHIGIFGCERCENEQPSFDKKPDTQKWLDHKMNHPTWAEWRSENGHPEPAIPWVCPDCKKHDCDGYDCREYLPSFLSPTSIG